MEDCIIYNNNSGGSPDGDEENPWEWEELRNREWDRKLQEMSNMCSVELTNATIDRHDVPYLDEAFLQWFSCFQFVFHEERWRRFSVALQDAYSENVALIVEDTFEEQLKLEAILFSEAFPKQRQQLARGLLIQVWRGVAPKSAPWYAKSAQLIQDIDACCFMKRLIDARSMINCDPLLLPYNDIAAAVDGFINGYFEDETAWSPYVEGDLIYRLFAEGFIPIAISIDISKRNKRLLIPKMHKDRLCLVPLDIIMTRKGKKVAKELRITIDTAFNKVVTGIVQQHGENWMYPEMQDAFNRMHYHRHRHEAGNTYLHSVEVWKGSELVAGEIGVATGAVYTSVTGFHTLPSSGTFQMYALGAILHFQGIELWDLGMAIPYKHDLGAQAVTRAEFIELFQQAKAKPRVVEVPERFRNCKDSVELLNSFSVEQRRRCTTMEDVTP